jgi:AcrR family transcriptional regulator
MANNSLLKLKEREREDRREIILHAAQELFSQRGISGVNMRDIAREAGVSVGFIYRYFDGQVDIFLELFEAGASEITQRMNVVLSTEKSDVLRVLAHAYIGYLHENRMFYQMMIYFMLEGELSDESLNRLNTALRSMVNSAEPVFRRGDEKGGDGRADSRTLAHSFFSALHGVMISFVNYPGRTPGEIRERTLILAETIANQFDQAGAT